MRLLWARIGDPHCPVCGEKIQRQTVQQIADQLMELETGTRYQVLAPVISQKKGEFVDLFKELAASGYSRAHRRRRGDPAHRARRRSRSRSSTTSRSSSTASSPADDLLTRLTDSRRDRAAASPTASSRSTSSTSTGPAACRTFSEKLQLPERPPGPAHRDRAAHLLVQRPVRRLPRVLRPRHQDGGRRRPAASATRASASTRASSCRGTSPARACTATSSGCSRASRATSSSTSTPRGASCPRASQDAILRGNDFEVQVQWQQPLRPRDEVHDRLRGRHALHRAQVPRGRDRLVSSSATASTCARSRARSATASG